LQAAFPCWEQGAQVWQLRIEKGALTAAYRRLQAEAENNLQDRPTL